MAQNARPIGGNRTNYSELTEIAISLIVTGVIGWLAWSIYTVSASTFAANLKTAGVRHVSGTMSLGHSAVLGSSTARIALIEFSDFQCSYCGEFARDVFPLIRRDFIDVGNVKFVFKQMPLSIHSSAKLAAFAADCAGREGRFWEMHDLLFRNQTELTAQDVRRDALGAGLHLNEFDECLSRGEESQIAIDTHDAKRLNVNGTPAFMMGAVGGDNVSFSLRIDGVRSYPVFKMTLDRLVEGASRFRPNTLGKWLRLNRQS